MNRSEKVINLASYHRSEGANWLKDLKVGDTFLSTAVGLFDSGSISEYTIRGISEKGYYHLRENRLSGGEDTSNHEWVRTKEFSNDNILLEKLE
jgi:hypothetical protein